jgi:hypothetical protein
MNQRESWTEPQPSSYAQALTAWNRGDYDAQLVDRGLGVGREHAERYRDRGGAAGDRRRDVPRAGAAPLARGRTH